VDPLVTAAELGLYLQRTVDPDAAALAVASASGMIRDICGWSISAETVTLVLDGSGTTILNLPTLRLVAVFEVRLWGVALDPSEYSWTERGQLYRAAGWPADFRAVAADVQHGYEQTPDTVRAVALSLAGATTTNPGGTLVSKTVGAVTHAYRDAPAVLTELQEFQLSGYRLP